MTLGCKITKAGPDHPIYRNGWTVGATRLPNYQDSGQPQNQQKAESPSQEESDACWLKDSVAQIALEAREQWSGFNLECIEAFKRGDRVGLPFEGNTMFQPVNEKRLKMALLSNQGSDESSIVDCFLRFAGRYRYSTREQFVWDWVDFHEQNRGTGYGRSYRDHFKLVAYLREHTDRYPDTGGRLRKLAEIAIDADSFGNGCLAIVYPAFFYAGVVGENPAEFVRYLTGFTHTNRNAMEAVTLLCSFIESPRTITDFFADSGISDDEVFRNRYCNGHASALNTLVTAVKCAMKLTDMAVIREGLRIGGDTDSTLATAMLLWTLRKKLRTDNGGYR